MVKQYPYLLQQLVQTAPEQDFEGNWIEGSESWVDVAKCRDISGNGKQIKGTDGSVMVVSFIVHCPKGTAALSQGTKVRVLDGSQVRVEGKVLYSDKAQLHTKIIC